MTTTFTGQKAYVTKKCRDLHRRGYSIVRQHRHPDGTETITMEYTKTRRFPASN